MNGDPCDPLDYLSIYTGSAVDYDDEKIIGQSLVCTDTVKQFYVAYNKVMTIYVNLLTATYTSPSSFRFQAKQGK